jgi:hypothetical protein
MKPRISISSLIYKSTKFADSVYASLRKFTPQLSSGEAEFFFIANDATEAVKSHLLNSGIPHFINDNEILEPSELVRRGIAKPEYIHRVYRGWNRVFEHAQGEIVVLVNSDMEFSPNWLDNLIKNVSDHRMVCSHLVERKHPKHGVFGGATHAECGTHPSNFQEDKFLKVAQSVSTPGLRPGGAFMPCAIYKHIALSVGLYPEGNLSAGTWDSVLRYGDEDFVYRLSKAGVAHVTATDSIVYHYKEGEMDE